jgi:hypothetical protein
MALVLASRNVAEGPSRRRVICGVKGENHGLPTLFTRREPAGQLNIHGGGFVIGHREQDDPLMLLPGRPRRRRRDQHRLGPYATPTVLGTLTAITASVEYHESCGVDNGYNFVSDAPEAADVTRRMYAFFTDHVADATGTGRP